MSKTLSVAELNTLVTSGIQKAKDYLTELVGLANDKSVKRASLIAYWLKDYIQYLKEEDSFNPRQMPRYERGNIIEVHFGYRVGSELGGRHYAVVLDVKNNWSSPVITVVPLTSLKRKYNENRFQLLLNDGLFDLVGLKCTEQIKLAEEELNQETLDFEKAKKIFENLTIKTKEDIEKYECEINRLKKVHVVTKIHINLAEKTSKSMDHLKSGSVLELGQITTVSKQRISNPKMLSDSLFGIKLSDNDMSALNEKLKSLYIFESSGK